MVVKVCPLFPPPSSPRGVLNFKECLWDKQKALAFRLFVVAVVQAPQNDG